MPIPYARYAAIYDQTGQAQFGEQLTVMTLEWLAERGEQPRSALDLATGTGAAAIELAKRGIDVVALDASPEMLQRAAAKADIAHLCISWQTGDMRQFTIEQPVDLVVSFFDSVNYLTELRDLRSCFASVAGCLRPGGWFIFDVNTIHRYATDWNNSAYVAFENDQLFCLFRSSFDPRTHRSPLLLTVYERDGKDQDAWHRWDEQHLERGYPLDQIRRMLNANHFDVLTCLALDEEAMRFTGPADESSARATFFARRRDESGKIPA